MKTPFRTRFQTAPRITLACRPETKRTKSEFQNDCDINLIMARYKKTGILPPTAQLAAANYGDFTQVPDFQEMQHKVIAAHEMFAALPAAVRKQFSNDPGEFIAASQTPEGRKLMQTLGLGKPSEEPSQPPGEPSPSSGGQPDPQTPPASPAPKSTASKAKSSDT